MRDNSEFEELRKKSVAQLKNGKSLFGKDGAFAPMFKEFLEATLEGEMDAHLDEVERSTGNQKRHHLQLKSLNSVHQ